VASLRARADRREGERYLWRALADYAERDAKDGERAAFWRPFAQADSKPVRLRDVHLHVGAGVPDVSPFVVLYHLWLVPAPGRVILFGYPAEYARNPTAAIDVYDEVRKRLLESRGKGQPLSDTARQSIADIERVGPLRYGFLFYPVFPDRPAGDNLPVVRIGEDGRILVKAGRRERAFRLPGPDSLESQIGRPPLLPSLPGREQVYLALDWSEYLSSPPRRKWLLAELRSALEDLAADDLTGGGVHLHGKGEVVCWPLSAIKEGKWPASLPAAHENDTLAALTKALRAADRAERPAHVTFITWNPEQSIVKTQAADEPGAEMARLADRLSLQIIQVLGKRLPCFEKLVGTNYFRAEYRPEGPPSLILPARDF
jgi:hypothetical protein